MVLMSVDGRAPGATRTGATRCSGGAAGATRARRRIDTAAVSPASASRPARTVDGARGLPPSAQT